MSSRTRKQTSQDQATMESFLNKKDTDSDKEPCISDLIKKLDILQANQVTMQKAQTAIQESIATKMEGDDSRLSKNEKTVEILTANVNRLTEHLEILIPRLSTVETKVSNIEEKLALLDDIDNKVSNIVDIDQALPRIGELEDRVNEIQATLSENTKLKERVTDLEEDKLWAEYERKRDNLVAYGVKGPESNEDTMQVVKNFMVEGLKLEKEWVENVQLKAVTRLQSNGEGPAPIRICYFYSKDRDKCLRAGVNLKGTNMAIRTDLPKAIRIKRAKLATSEVYRMKKRDDIFNAKLRERGIMVWIEYKTSEKGDWITKQDTRKNLT